MTDHAKFMTDRLADASVIAVIAGLLPAIVAVLGAIYYVLQIWESKTVADWRARRAEKIAEHRASMALGVGVPAQTLVAVDLSDGLAQEAEALKKLVFLQIMSLWSKIVTGIAALGALAVQINEIVTPVALSNTALAKLSMVLTLVATASSVFALLVHYKKAELAKS